jgi:hypothetical protein
VNSDGVADEVFMAVASGSGRAISHSGAPGPNDVPFDKLVIGDESFRGGVSAAEGFDTDGDGVPELLVLAPGAGGGAVLAVVGPGGSRGIQVGPDDYRAGVQALDGFRLSGHTSQDVGPTPTCRR